MGRDPVGLHDLAKDTPEGYNGKYAALKREGADFWRIDKATQETMNEKEKRESERIKKEKRYPRFLLKCGRTRSMGQTSATAGLNQTNKNRFSKCIFSYFVV